MSKLINIKLIKKLNPCEERLENAIKHYKGKSFTKARFMGLKNITQEDKLWVALRLMPKENIRFAAAEIARSVLHVFEDKYPDDDRPRKAIEAAEAKHLDKKVAQIAANHAGYGTTCASAYAAVYAADAAYTAESATRSIDNAYYAATYAVSAATDKAAQEKLIRKILLKYWK